ncbi:olfactory receptor 8G17-like [Conger conger]|uniref:olfactory receptor 8G17-like n=1 Tax=Conger conger TaxID=82655 RepID=UPI002A59C4C9|nr:olfactory receptor 8G17-like [Conger conger]
MLVICFAETLHTPKYMAVFSLAVVDISLSSALIPKAIHIIYIIVLYFAPSGFIAVSYMFIINAILKIKSSEGRWKAFKTCSSHLMLVAIFFVPFYITYIVAWHTGPVK